jgi:hypothetical protein
MGMLTNTRLMKNIPGVNQGSPTRLAVLAAVLETPGMPPCLEHGAEKADAPYCPWLPWRMFVTARQVDVVAGLELEKTLTMSLGRATTARAMSSGDCEAAAANLSAQHGQILKWLVNLSKFASLLRLSKRHPRTLRVACPSGSSVRWNFLD